LTVVKTIQNRTKTKFCKYSKYERILCILSIDRNMFTRTYIYKALKLGNINLYGRTSTSVMSKIHAKQPH